MWGLRKAQENPLDWTLVVETGSHACDDIHMHTCRPTRPRHLERSREDGAYTVQQQSGRQSFGSGCGHSDAELKFFRFRFCWCPIVTCSSDILLHAVAEFDQLAPQHFPLPFPPSFLPLLSRSPFRFPFPLHIGEKAFGT